MEYKYDVAISFAEEDRNAALALALALEMRGCKKIYYYPEQRVATWGRSLKEKLERIYSIEARYAVVLLSNHYFDSKKEYTLIEFAAIEKRMKKEPGLVYMLPVKLNSAESFEIHDSLRRGYLDWQYNPKRVAEALLKRLGKPATPPPKRVKVNLIINK